MSAGDTRPRPPRLLALGDAAWTLEFGQAIDEATQARVGGLAACLAPLRAQEPLLAGITDVVATFRSLTVHYDPWTTDGAALGRRLLALAAQDRRALAQGRRWRLPVCFDEDFGPDLVRVCEARGLARADLIARLLAVPLRVGMIGFQPGFPYLSGLPPALATPRLATPRQRVPAHSVAIAGAMCAVYPWDSPGGWNLLGRTPVVLFDPRQGAQPAMLAAGDELQWAEVDRAAYERLAAEIARGLPRTHFLAEAPA